MGAFGLYELKRRRRGSGNMKTACQKQNNEKGPTRIELISLEE
jgi:hypothetical protein